MGSNPARCASVTISAGASVSIVTEAPAPDRGMSRTAPFDCAKANADGTATKITSAGPRTPFILLILPPWTAPTSLARLGCFVGAPEFRRILGIHYVDFTREMNLSIVDSVVEKDVTKRTKT